MTHLTRLKEIDEKAKIHKERLVKAMGNDFVSCITDVYNISYQIMIKKYSARELMDFYGNFCRVGEYAFAPQVFETYYSNI
jgi:hypothetical protein